MLDSILNNPNIVPIAIIAALGLGFLIATIVGFVGWSKQNKIDNMELPDFEELGEEEALPDLEEESMFQNADDLQLSVGEQYDEAEMSSRWDKEEER